MSDNLTGSYFLRTNLVTMGPKELWQLYNTLRGFEDAFRFMKSSLGLRPVYHHKEHRVDGHLWITIMAYHLIQHCLYQLKKQNITLQWVTARDIILEKAVEHEKRSTIFCCSRSSRESGHHPIGEDPFYRNSLSDKRLWRFSMSNCFF